MASLELIELGLRDYEEMVSAQERLVAARLDGSTDDQLIVLEHPPTYTLGKRSEPTDLIHDTDWYREHGIAVCDTPRGGKVTYHGPGQLVIYPIIDLRSVGTQPAGADRVDVARFVYVLEEAMAGALAGWGLTAGRIEGLTGLWIDDDRPSAEDFDGADAINSAAGVARGSIRKVGSIGLKIHRGVTSHGLSLNVDCDLEPFSWINSCGIESCRATSIAAELDAERPTVQEAGLDVAGRIADALGRELVARAGGPDPAGPRTTDSVA